MNRSSSSSSTRPPVRGPLGLRPVVAGTLCCVVSALGYTGANICMRQLTEFTEGLPEEERLNWAMWFICNKELVTVAVVGPWLLCRLLRRQRVLPSGRMLTLLVVVGLFVQLGANAPIQWAFGVVGIAVVIPAIFGVMLTASAAMGRIFLGERVSRRSMAAIGLLLAALVTLGVALYVSGSPDTARSEQKDIWTIVLGIAAPCLAGVIYAVLTITIRHAATGATPTSTIVFITTLMGVLALGPLSFHRLGTDILADTSATQYAWMLAAGTLNLVAFLAIAKGLELTTVVHVNVLNASQVAMAAVAGVVFFSEMPTFWKTLGVGLTIAGVVLFDRPVDEELDADHHV